VGLFTPSAHDKKLNIPVVVLAQADGKAILDLLRSSKEATIQTPSEHHSFSVPTGGMHPIFFNIQFRQKSNILCIGFISTFSSWGLAPDLEIKPEISAPGGQIFST
jgi:hypothetical protein